MKNGVFGELEFHCGWEMPVKICFFDREYSLTLCVEADDEKEGVSTEQEAAYTRFIQCRERILCRIEGILLSKSKTEAEAIRRYEPQLLLFKQDGGYGMVFADRDDMENGIAVSIEPCYEIIADDVYLI